MIIYEFDAERFSRWMSYVLRHNPTRYGLQPDRHGYVDLEQFLRIAKQRYPQVTAERLRALLEAGGTERFEMLGGQLRARYGHSIPVEPTGPPVEPPESLYHGTDGAQLERIFAEGLQPVGRQLLHLSETPEDALAIARRKSDHPAVVRVLARNAHAAGIRFYREGRVSLTSAIPPSFLSVVHAPV